MYPSIQEQYIALSEEDRKIYDHLHFAEAIEGWILAQEAVELYRLVFTITHRPAVFCEIGTWMGKSASILGKAALDRGDALVFTVDPFTGVGDAPSVAEYQRQRAMLQKTQEETCRETLDRVGVSSVVRLLAQKSADARASFPETFLDGLFIDGDHTYESVHEDVMLWYSLLRPGSWIALHDVLAVHVDGPRRVMEELRRDKEKWMDWRIVGEMAVARRR